MRGVRKSQLGSRYWWFLILTARKWSKKSPFDILVLFLNFLTSLGNHFWLMFWHQNVFPCFCRFFSELGPGSVIFGFLAKNWTAYTNFQPDWCHGNPFHEQFMFLLIFGRFFAELGPGSVIIGFSASNYIGYTNSRPNWRQESLFHDQIMFFMFLSSQTCLEHLKNHHPSRDTHFLIKKWCRREILISYLHVS